MFLKRIRVFLLILGVICLGVLLIGCNVQHSETLPSDVDSGIIDEMKEALKNELPPDTTVLPDVSESSNTQETTAPEEDLPANLLYGCAWDASVQTSQLFQFYSDGTGRVLNLASQLSGKGLERTFSYTISGSTVCITDEHGDQIQWKYSYEDQAFRIDYGVNEYISVCRVSLWDLYNSWAEALVTEIKENGEQANNQSQQSMTSSAGTAYSCWQAALDALYIDLSLFLSKEEKAALDAEQQLWMADRDAAAEEAGALFEGGSIYPMIVADSRARTTEIRFYELLLRLPEGFDRETHSKQIQDIRDKYAATQDSYAAMGTKFFSTVTTGYYLDGALYALHEASDISQTEDPYNYSVDTFFNCRKYWYYDGSFVYFIHMVNEENGDEYRLYYHEGELIRWIAPNGTVYDYGYRWDEMQEFYAHALSQCEFAAANPPE